MCDCIVKKYPQLNYISLHINLYIASFQTHANLFASLHAQRNIFFSQSKSSDRVSLAWFGLVHIREYAEYIGRERVVWKLFNCCQNVAPTPLLNVLLAFKHLKICYLLSLATQLDDSSVCVCVRVCVRAYVWRRAAYLQTKNISKIGSCYF